MKREPLKITVEDETSVLFQRHGVEIQLSVPSNELKRESSVGYSFLLILVGLCTTIGSAIPVGYNIGVINSPSNYIKNWCRQIFLERYDVSLEESSLDILFAVIVSIFLVGGAVGSLCGAFIADRFGRKGSFLICGALFLSGSIFFSFCRSFKSYEMLLIGRFLVGLASGLCTTSLPMYLTEIAPLSLRGALGTFCAIGVTAGVVVGQIFSLKSIFGSELYWHYALSSYVLFLFICYLPSYYFPESPKFLFLIKNQREQAKEVLCKLRNNNVTIVNQELEELHYDMMQSTEKKSILKVLKDPKLLLPLTIVAAFMGGQQLSGINAIFYYSTSIFKKAGLNQTSAEWANLGAGCINLLTSLLGPYLMKKYNRRPLMMFSCAIDAFLLFTVGLTINFIDSFSWLPLISIVSIFLYIFFYQFGLGPIPYFIGSELFETEPRPVAMAVGSLSSWSCNFIIGMTFPSLQSALGSGVFIPFSITCVLLFILTKYYLPETKERQQSEIVKLVCNGFRSRPLEFTT